VIIGAVLALGVLTGWLHLTTGGIVIVTLLQGCGSSWSQRIYFGRAPMAVMSKRDRAQQVVLVVLGLLTIVTNIYPLVTYFLAGLRPTGGTAAPMFWTILATLGVFLVLAARNPSAYRSLIAYAAWSSVAHTAVMALMATQLPTKRGELLIGAAVTGLGAVLLFVFAPPKETGLATS
jgi:hypothetical protein